MAVVYQNRHFLGVLVPFSRVFRLFLISFGLYFRFESQERQNRLSTQPPNEVSSHVLSRRSYLRFPAQNFAGLHPLVKLKGIIRFELRCIGTAIIVRGNIAEFRCCTQERATADRNYLVSHYLIILQFSRQQKSLICQAFYSLDRSAYSYIGRDDSDYNRHRLDQIQ
jgi:hypothetical protein